MTTYDFNPAEVLTLRGCEVDDLCFNATGSQRMLGKRLPCKMSGWRADGEDAGSCLNEVDVGSLQREHYLEHGIQMQRDGLMGRHRGRNSLTPT